MDPSSLRYLEAEVVDYFTEIWDKICEENDEEEEIKKGFIKAFHDQCQQLATLKAHAKTINEALHEAVEEQTRLFHDSLVIVHEIRDARHHVAVLSREVAALRAEGATEVPIVTAMAMWRLERATREFVALKPKQERATTAGIESQRLVERLTEEWRTAEMVVRGCRRVCQGFKEEVERQGGVPGEVE